MRHDWIRFPLALPLVFGFLAAVLMTWDYENNRMVGLMGMGWDTGPPFWPYHMHPDEKLDEDSKRITEIVKVPELPEIETFRRLRFRCCQS